MAHLVGRRRRASDGAARLMLLGLVVVASEGMSQGRVVPAGRLMAPRTHHTATALKDGRVLVVGGRGVDGLTALSSVELFEPRTQRWRSGAPMSTGRSQHTATLLEDGRVLVTGGLAEASSSDSAPSDSARFVALASAEIYDPKMNRWAQTAPMAEARNGHTATLLADGSVLVVGGAREQRVDLSAVERFDPKSGRFELLSPLIVPRAQHVAVRLGDGSVVVLGGRTRAAGSGAPVVSVSLAVSPVVLDAVEQWLPATLTWHLLPPLTEGRQRSAAVVVGGALVVIGGQTATSSTNLVEGWTPWTPPTTSWRSWPSLSMGLAAHSATALPSGDVVVIGGEPSISVDTPRIQRWRHELGQWCVAGELRSSRKGHTATLVSGGRVLVVGGTSGGLPEASVEVWEGALGPCGAPPSLPSSW